MIHRKTWAAETGGDIKKSQELQELAFKAGYAFIGNQKKTFPLPQKYLIFFGKGQHEGILGASNATIALWKNNIVSYEEAKHRLQNLAAMDEPEADAESPETAPDSPILSTEWENIFQLKEGADVPEDLSEFNAGLFVKDLSPEQSTELQLLAFAREYTWLWGEKEVRYESAPYLFFEHGMRLTFGHSHPSGYDLTYKYLELTFEQMKKWLEGLPGKPVLKIEEPTKFYVEIPSPQLSRALQRLAIAAGYVWVTWGSDGAKIMHTDKKILCFDPTAHRIYWAVPELVDGVFASLNEAVNLLGGVPIGDQTYIRTPDLSFGQAMALQKLLKACGYSVHWKPLAAGQSAYISGDGNRWFTQYAWELDVSLDKYIELPYSVARDAFKAIKMGSHPVMDAMGKIVVFPPLGDESVLSYIPLQQPTPKRFKKEYYGEQAKQRVAQLDIAQKAKSLMLAAMYRVRVPGVLPEFSVFLPEDQVGIHELPSVSDLFVRPCPYTPNHGQEVAGFSSQLVERENVVPHIRDVQQAMREKEPKGAIMVMPYIESVVSAVAAPNKYIAVAKGNDGVTAGKGRQVVLGLSHEDHVWAPYVREKVDKCELEYVCKDNSSSDEPNIAVHSYLVQIRRAETHVEIGAPPTKDARPGFVPQGSMTIKRIYVIRDLNDLGELEVLKTMDTEGLLVVQTEGALVSHAAAHCRGSKIAFVIDDPDNWKKGNEIFDARGWVVREKTGDAYRPEDYEEHFWRGVELARTNWERHWGQIAPFFHQFTSAPLNNPEETAYLAGIFAGWLAMAGSSACLGEARHVRTKVHPSQKQRYDYGNRIEHVLRAIEDDPSLEIAKGVTREGVYNGFLKWAPSWQGVRMLTDLVAEVHTYGGWKKDDPGYGGANWARCSVLTSELVQEIINRDLNRVIVAANALENAVHNGGNLFNKHLHPEFFAIATQGGHLLNTVYLNFTIQSGRMAIELLDKGSELEPRMEPTPAWEELVEETLTMFPDTQAIKNAKENNDVGAPEDEDWDEDEYDDELDDEYDEDGDEEEPEFDDKAVYV